MINIYFSLSRVIQDFGATIPGHGGFTDRMDCQVSFLNIKILVEVTKLSLLFA